MKYKTKRSIELILAASVAVGGFFAGKGEPDFRKAAEAIVARVPAKKIVPMPVEELTALLKKGQMACALRDDSRQALAPLYVSQSDPRYQMLSGAYALAALMPGYLEKTAYNGEKMPTQEALCQSSAGPTHDTKTPFGSQQAGYRTAALLATNSKISDPARSALNLFHEHVHHLFNIVSLVLWNGYTHKADAAFSSVIEEANAQTRELIAAYAMKLRGDDRFWKAFDRPAQKKYMEEAAAIYDEAGLADYAKKYGTMPPLLTRLAYTYVARDLVNFDGFNTDVKYEMTKEHPGSKGPDGLGLTDDYIAKTLGKMDESFANAPDLYLYLWHRTPAGYTNFDNAVTMLKGKSTASDYRALIKEVQGLISPQQKGKTYTEFNNSVIGLLDTLKKDKQLDYLFVLHDLQKVSALFRPVLQEGGFTPQETAIRANVLNDFDVAIQNQINLLCQGKKPVRVAANNAASLSVNSCR